MSENNESPKKFKFSIDKAFIFSIIWFILYIIILNINLKLNILPFIPNWQYHVQPIHGIVAGAAAWFSIFAIFHYFREMKRGDATEMAKDYTLNGLLLLWVLLIAVTWFGPSSKS